MSKAFDGRSFDAALEQAAQICEKPIGIQHPMKPIGVSMSTVPPSPHHANVIRGMKGTTPPEPPEDGGQ